MMFLIDEEDAWLLDEVSWSITGHGYVAGRLLKSVHGKAIHVYLHHCIMGCPIWDREEIDHINRDGTDNRRSNLRWVTHSQNLVNNGQPVGQTGVRGLTISASGKYIAQVKRGGINHYLGSFDTMDEAAAERDEWLSQH